MKKLYIIIGLLGAIFLSQNTKAQDLEKLKDLKKIKPKDLLKGKGISIKGSLTSNVSYYDMEGSENRRTPFRYLVAGNLNFDFMGKIKMPFSFSFTNQNATLNNPFSQGLPLAQPFNRFVFKPAYKGFVLQIGTVAQTFSPFTLAGHRYEGVGLNYKSNKFPIYGGLMFGSLARRIASDSLLANKPSYQRMGYGMQLGYKKEKDFVEFIIFAAKDNYHPTLATLDKKNILPQANVVTSLNFSKQIIKNLFISSEYAVSGLTADTRATDGYASNGFLRTFGGLLNPNATTIYKKAIKAGLSYKSPLYQVGVEYSSIDPKYRTLGGYYFVQGIETYKLKGATQLFDKKISLSSDIATQGDLIDKNSPNPQTARRLVSALNIGYTPNDKLNLMLGYSGFTNYTNFNPEYAYLAQVKSLAGLDTLNYRQINQNFNSNLILALPAPNKEIKRNLMLSALVQQGKDEVGDVNNISSLNNVTVNYSNANQTLKSNWSAGVNLTNSQTAQAKTMLVGPVFSYNRGFLKDKLKTNAGVNYAFSNTNSSIANGSQTFGVFSFRLGASYPIKDQHNFQLSAVYLNKNTPNSDQKGANFKEITISLNYSYNFKLLDLKFK